MEAFARWISQVGEGEVQGISISEDGEPNWIKIPYEFLIQNDEDGVQNLIAAVYPNFVTEHTDSLYLQERGIPEPTNDDVDEINSIMLSMVPRVVKTYMSCDTLSNSNNCGAFSDIKPPGLLHSLKISGLPNHCL